MALRLGLLLDTGFGDRTLVGLVLEGTSVKYLDRYDCVNVREDLVIIYDKRWGIRVKLY